MTNNDDEANFIKCLRAERDRADGNGHTPAVDDESRKKDRPSSSSPFDPDLIEMNAQWAVVQFGSRVRIMSVNDPKVMLRDNEFQLLYRNRLKQVDSGDWIRLGNWWLCHSMRRAYEGVEFVPGGPSELRGKNGPRSKIFNTWRGWGVNTNPDGDCSLWLKHTLEIVCSGNDEHY